MNRCSFPSKQRCFSNYWKWTAQYFPHIPYFFSTLWITNWSLHNLCQIASIPLKWVQHTLPIQSQWKKKIRKRKKQQTMIFLMNLGGTQVSAFQFSSGKQKLKIQTEHKLYGLCFNLQNSSMVICPLHINLHNSGKQFWNNLKLCVPWNFKNRAQGISKQARTNHTRANVLCMEWISLYIIWKMVCATVGVCVDVDMWNYI